MGLMEKDLGPLRGRRPKEGEQRLNKSLKVHKGISPNIHCDGLTTPCGVWKSGRPFKFSFKKSKVTCKRCKK